MTKLVAVSGGVDSVVLLDILARGEDQLIVAHVDHGIRGEESRADARFVRALAKNYRLPYLSTELNLGEEASEEEARSGRYEFLFSKAKQFKAEIVTAHHADDMIGSLAINIHRGTGWRGLTVLNRQGISRPLLGWSKQKVYDYALTRRLEWVEDESNYSDKYLRNKLRRNLGKTSEDAKKKLINLRYRQLQLTKAIDQELFRASQSFADKRHPLIMVDQSTAIEILRFRYSLARPQSKKLLQAIKTARPGSSIDVGDGWRALMTKEAFVVEKPSLVVE